MGLLDKIKKYFKLKFGKLSEKERATMERRPWVSVVKIEIDPVNNSVGMIELDFNEEFVRSLQRDGFTGHTSEEIVDAWLSTVCKSIAINLWEEENDDQSAKPNRRDLGEGRYEIS